jgi:hypothetical protein
MSPTPSAFKAAPLSLLCLQALNHARVCETMTL